MLEQGDKIQLVTKERLEHFLPIPAETDPTASDSGWEGQLWINMNTYRRFLYLGTAYSDGQGSGWMPLPQVLDRTATITTDWTGSAAPYSQVIAVDGMSAEDTPLVDLVQSGSETEDEPMRAAFGKVTRITTQAGGITVYASDKLTVAMPIRLKVVR